MVLGIYVLLRSTQTANANIGRYAVHTYVHAIGVFSILNTIVKSSSSLLELRMQKIIHETIRHSYLLNECKYELKSFMPLDFDSWI